MKENNALREEHQATVSRLENRVDAGLNIKGLASRKCGSRSAIDWIIERYQVKTDKASGIINDPNDWADEQGNPRYILDLLARIVTVSVETVKIVKSLPPLEHI
jgi:site-specific recombinase XerC